MLPYIAYMDPMGNRSANFIETMMIVVWCSTFVKPHAVFTHCSPQKMPCRSTWHPLRTRLPKEQHGPSSAHEGKVCLTQDRFDPVLQAQCDSLMNWPMVPITIDILMLL